MRLVLDIENLKIAAGIRYWDNDAITFHGSPAAMCLCHPGHVYESPDALVKAHKPGGEGT